jgi:hypothetical protein
MESDQLTDVNCGGVVPITPNINNKDAVEDDDIFDDALQAAL